MSWQGSFAALLALAILWSNRANSLQVPPFIPCEHAYQNRLSIAARVPALCTHHHSTHPPPHPLPGIPPVCDGFGYKLVTMGNEVRTL
ncbi:hypothetical protein PENSPDRAFT_660146 [Peniophora sp. CONT]|nr:hypothetical protein PENSPDRAFT_660146 [Peniophora sp. CONT]